MITPYFAGLWIGLSMIMAIGPQSCFVLRQGLLRKHVFAVCLFGTFSDVALISVGWWGNGIVLSEAPALGSALRWGGIAMLSGLGARALLSAWRQVRVPQPLAHIGGGLGVTLAAMAALTWLNPHVWLETAVVLGSLAARPDSGGAFVLGAATASALFFFGLGYGARLLQPMFRQRASWFVLDAVTGAAMWTMAGVLVLVD